MDIILPNSTCGPINGFWVGAQSIYSEHKTQEIETKQIIKIKGS